MTTPTLETAINLAQRRADASGQAQVVYLSQPQPKHYLWCSQRAWLSQQKLTPQGVVLVQPEEE